MVYEDSDEHFLGYVDLHSQTPRALFHINDVKRFLKLAGRNDNISGPDFMAMHDYEISDMLAEARKNLKNESK
jgi:hypothetical protein